MAEHREAFFLGSASTVTYHGPKYPVLALTDSTGVWMNLHLSDWLPMGDEARKADALATLDKLAAAIQAAMLDLAPETFPQPGPDDPTDDPTDDPATPPIIVHEAWGNGDGPVMPSYQMAHPMTENESRAIWGDR